MNDIHVCVATLYSYVHSFCKMYRILSILDFVCVQMLKIRSNVLGTLGGWVLSESKKKKTKQNKTKKKPEQKL